MLSIIKPLRLLACLVITLVSVAASCRPTSTTTTPPPPTPSATTPPRSYSVPQLKYQLITNFGELFWCDPDFYPVARVGAEEQNAQAQFAAIRSDAAEFAVILKQLNLADKADYTLDEKVLVYREHKKLSYAVQLAPAGRDYTFSLRKGQGQGERIEGTITEGGKISITLRQTSFNTCPICLPAGTQIETPDGLVAVEGVRSGMLIWTVDETGDRATGLVIETGKTPVQPGLPMVRVTLSDGRSVTASPGHPTADGKPLGSYQPADTLDGAIVSAVDVIDYDGGFTYDILPNGVTSWYWSNGVRLGSTLARR